MSGETLEPEGSKGDASFAVEYEERCAGLPLLGTAVASTLTGLLRSEKLPVHSVTHRVKSRESAFRKLTDERKSYSSLDDLQDLLGVRVITYVPEQVDAVAELVEREFKIDRANSVDRRQTLDPDRFGYLSVHYIAALNNVRSSLAEYGEFAGEQFEIQIRTILQHTWAEIEHDLGYKTESSVPRPLRRRLSRLAGLLELADAEFEAVRDSIAEYQMRLAETVERSPERITIDRDSVFAFIRTEKRVSQLDASIALLFGAPLAELKERDASVHAEELQAAGFATVEEVREGLRKHENVIRDFSTAWIKERNRGVTVAPGISLFYLCYVVLAERGNPDEIARYLRSQGIGDVLNAESGAQRVISVYRQVTT